MDENLRTQILRMKREGRTYNEIADRLSVSKSTISKASLADSTGEYRSKRGAGLSAALPSNMAKNHYIAEKKSTVLSASQYRTQYRTTRPEMAEYFNRIREANTQRNAHLKTVERMSSDGQLLNLIKSLLWAIIVGIIFYLIFKKREDVEIFESVTQTNPDPLRDLPLARLDLARIERESMARA